MRDTPSKEDVESLLDELHPDRVFAVEDGRVWVSGMNAHCVTVAENLAQTLVAHDIPCGLVYDDGIHAVDNGGVQFNYGPGGVAERAV